MSSYELYRSADLPVFQNRMYSTSAAARNCPRGDLVLVEDQVTGLVYNAAFRPELVNYDANYQNEQGVSSVFLQHLGVVADKVIASMGRQNLVEVGCGKGLFLEILAARGVGITGFDPAYEGNNERITRRYFGEDLGLKADGLILRHVLEHIPDPVDFLCKLRDANGGGKIYIEVPCLDWILDHRAWFDVFYEHVNYFRLGDFARMFGTVYSAERIFSGQYLGIFADLASVRAPRRDPAHLVEFPEDFHRTMRVPSTGPCGVWGAASKGVLFTLMMERLGGNIVAVIDINPAKQGRYLPASGLQVLSPAVGLSKLEDGAILYVMNSNYFVEIQQMSQGRMTYVRIDDE